MSDGPEWFAPKRYGYGAGLPISWQGWVLTIVLIASILGVAVGVGRRPLLIIGIVMPLVIIFTVICARTTRGGWRWRWGDKE